MSASVVGLVLGVTFVACVAVVLMAMADIARGTPQGGRVAIASAPSWAPAPMPSRPGPPVIKRPPAGYVGRHRP